MLCRDTNASVLVRSQYTYTRNCASLSSAYIVIRYIGGPPPRLPRALIICHRDYLHFKVAQFVRIRLSQKLCSDDSSYTISPT